MKFVGVIVPMLLIFGAISCEEKTGGQDTTISTTPTPSITVQQLCRLAESDRDIFVMDVRTEPEFEQLRLAFADIRLPYDSLSGLLGLLPQDTTAEMYCFCRTGRRSAISTDYLRSIGYTNVYNVSGGIAAWRQAGYPTVSGKWTPPGGTK